MKIIETRIFEKKDADDVGGAQKLRKRHEAQGFRLVEDDPETLRKLYCEPEDGTVVLVMDREVPVPAGPPPQTAARPTKRVLKSGKNPAIKKEAPPLSGNPFAPINDGGLNKRPAVDCSHPECPLCDGINAVCSHQPCDDTGFPSDKSLALPVLLTRTSGPDCISENSALG